jgi:hypothetical protein
MTRLVDVKTVVNANIHKPSVVDKDATAGTAMTTAAGIGTVPSALGATCSATEYGDGVFHKTVFTCTATSISLTDEDGIVQHGGTKIYDFPAGALQIYAGSIVGNLTAAAPIIDNYNGDIACGSIVASNNADGLAATEQNIVQTSALNAGASDKISPVSKVSTATTLTESLGFTLDGTSTPVDMYLNVLIDDNVAHIGAMTATFTGTITVCWFNFGGV